MAKSVVIIGDGAWGLALAHVCYSAGSQVWVCTRKSPEEAAAIARKRYDAWPECIVFCNHIKQVIDKKPLVFLAIASCALGDALRSIASCMPTLSVVCASKGFAFWQGEALLPHDLYRRLTNGQGCFAYVFGPSFAGEVLEKRITSLVIASEHEELKQTVHQCLHVPWLAISACDDAQGVAICGLFKNVVAFTMGMIHALGYGENAKAMLFCYAMRELAQGLVALGSLQTTAYSYAGLGDALLSGYAATSRNFQAGVSACSSLCDKSTQGLTESAQNIAYLYKYMQCYRVQSNVVHAVWSVLGKQENPHVVVERLYREVMQQGD